MSISNQALASCCDVVVIGGGLSGKAASLHLAKAGLKVTRIEPATTVRSQSANLWIGRAQSC
jgi:flavin-dependent dehydrogenase